MKTSPNAQWDSCLALISKEVSEQTYNTWFKPIVFESFDSDSKTLLIQVPNFYVREYLEENYEELLRRVLTQVFGQGVVLLYRPMADRGRGRGVVMQSEAVEVAEIPQSSRPASAPAQGKTASATQKGATSAQQLAPIDSQLNPRMTFKNYIEGDSNKMARSVGLSIAEHPQNLQFNPFFIYGPSGCGKTHLVNAIGVHAKQLYPEKRVLYVSARLFEVQYTTAQVRQNTINDFINFYQTIDVLIIDDIQEWEDKKGTQNTFFYIFNHLFRNAKRIILVSDRPPVELKGINERLLTRFSCGLITELEKPNVQLCRDILRSKMRHDGLQFPDNVVEYIAQTANGSVRDLYGVLNSLMAYSIFYNCNIDLRLAERIIKRAVKVDNEPLTVDEIVEKVCAHYKVTASAINGRSRKREIVLARQLSMYLAQKLTKMPTNRIGKLIGGRDHSTVIYSCNQVEQRLKFDRAFTEEVASIENSFKLKGGA